ncbi:hypothetical protein RI129_011725 [Pyrocoelia pectoralis]|uniref:Galactosylgalactosylxylosylprotein 3-beta-glucuronosyltransferase n=1 Tax=Pyrocoelia pectoralis TaxID=417401 RepID=A0AAN7ZHE2_9COLE
MRIPIKMCLVIIIGCLVVLYQYRLSRSWVQPQQHSDIQEIYSIKASDGNRVTESKESDAKNCCLMMPPYLRKDIDVPPLYIITPTYRRAEQLPELTRFAHTLMLVPNVYWLVIEDAFEKSSLVAKLLEKTGLRYEHLIAPMPEQYKNKKSGPKPRGVSNRNRGIQWVRDNAADGVMYFADDDNTYDLELFHEMRYTKRVSMFPVGLITKLGVSSPVVKNGVFSGFYDGWIAGRKFPVDMAGFAVSVKFLLQRPNATMPYKPGYEEDGFLKSLKPFEPKEIELLASNCSRILVWHTQTKRNDPSSSLDLKAYGNTNIAILKKSIM